MARFGLGDRRDRGCPKEKIATVPCDKRAGIS